MRRSLIFLQFAGALVLLSASVVSAAALAPMTLVKGSGSTVYYLAQDGKRYVFPNESVFLSWYPLGTQPKIQTISDSELAKIPLGKNISYRPGTVLVKIVTDPRVYAVSRGGVLHWVTSELLARQLYGPQWNRLVRDVPDVFFSDYRVESPLQQASEYSPSSEMMATKTIQENLPPMAQGDQWMTPDQKRRAEALTSVFENGTPTVEYAWMDDIRDGRGFTGGRAGFTTATGDAYMVIQRYVERVPTSPLAKYVPALRRLADTQSADTSAIADLPIAWRAAAQDPVFRQVQDQVVDELYYRPAMRAADEVGLKTALGRAIFYDTIIQHGGGSDPDSLSSIVRRTTEVMKGTPKSGISEASWISTFLRARREVLTNATDPETRQAWAASAGRVDVLRDVLESGNLNLDRAFTIQREPYQASIG